MKIIYNKLLVFYLSAITVAGFGQVQQEGTPRSFADPGLKNMAIPVELMQGIDLERLNAEDGVNDLKKDIPWRFGENLFVNINPSNSGLWNSLSNGDKLWRLTIKCPGALTINLTFDRYKLPPGADLFIYNTDYSHVIGAFTDFNNQEDLLFATTLIRGEEITLEYFEPANPEFTGELNLYRVTHGYRDAYDFVKSFGGSGSCNNNVACPEAIGWENETSSVCMLVTGGSGFCSGALVNNTSQNGVPYILTANHCYSSPGSWVFWFNWESPTCSNPASSPPYNSISGATLKARNADSDFCLVQMNSTPPSNYYVFYAGWNRENAPSTSSVGIHHPSGDIKKISFDYNPTTSSDYEPAVYLANSHWKITQWEDGTTEPGSSGSPLFDQNHRIVGQLHGGYASCTSLTADYYGKFSMSWDRGTTSATRLRDWLDPGNIAGLTLNGYDPNAGTDPPVANFSANNTNPGVNTQVSFTDLSSNNPTSWLWSFSPTTVTYLNSTSETTRNPQVSFNQTGYYTVTLTANNAYGSDSETKTNYINVISCVVEALPFSESFSTTSLPTCWTQVDHQGNGQVWQFGIITGQSPNPALTGNYAFLNSDAYGIGNSQNADLITPTLNLSAYSTVTLQFNHYYKSYAGSSGTLSYSINNGSSWTTIQTFTTTSATNPAAFNQVIAAVSGQPEVKFKWNYTGTYGYYWAFDNVLITGTIVTPTLTVLPSNQNVLPQAGTTAFSVTSNSNWTVSCNQPWCSVTPSGTGNGSITANFSGNNTDLQRVANITVTVTGLDPVVVTVTQAAPTLSVTPPNQDVTSTAGNTEFTVGSNTTWIAGSDQSWCNVTPSGTGDGTITATFTENTTPSPRIATITVTVQGLSPVLVTVTQDGIPGSEFLLTIRNITQTSALRMEFDIILQDMDASEEFELASTQSGIYINPGISSGTLTVSIIGSSSELLPSQQPTAITYDAENDVIKLNGRVPPGFGYGTIISTTGTRVCRIRVTSSVPFASSSTPDLEFYSSGVLAPLYATRVAMYDYTNAYYDETDPDNPFWNPPPLNTSLVVTPGYNANVTENPLLNPPPTLEVTPENQVVTYQPGTAFYNVTSNAGWSANSNQTWCTVTNSGFGNGIITADFSENISNLSRNAIITVSVAGLPVEEVTLTQEGNPGKILNLTLLLEGLYGANGIMNPAMNASGVQWGADIADLITVEFHDQNNYGNIVFSVSNVNLYTNGTASIAFPAVYNESYFVTIRHRNSIETVSAEPILFNTPNTDYNFNLPVKAFGNNLKQTYDGWYVIYGGDVNQDGSVDTGDFTPVDNDQLNFATGYLLTDINGDGSVDTGDFSIIDNNQLNFVAAQLP